MPPPDTTDPYCATPPGYTGTLPDQGPAKSIDPRGGLARFNRLCTLGLKYHLLGGLIQDHLRFHFSDPSNMEDRDLRGYVWSQDRGSGILIQSHYKWTPDQAGKRPALVVKRNTASTQRTVIADKSRQNSRGDRTEYSIMWVGSHTVFCLADQGAGSEILGAEVAHRLLEYGAALIENFGLFAWKVIDAGAVGVLEEQKQGFVVPVTVGWAYEHNWALERESRTLRSVKLEQLLDLG